MSAYSIVSVTVHDPALFQQYVDGHKDSLKAFGGSFLVASQDFESIEGAWPGQIVVVHRWPDRASFHAWYDSKDYRPWREMRFASATATVILANGIPGELGDDDA